MRPCALSICLAFFVFVGINAHIIQAQQTEPNSEEILKAAIIDFDGKRFEKCLASLNRAIEINHNGELSDILYYYRALTYVKLNNDAEALKDLDTAVYFNNKKLNYLNLRSDLKMRMLNFEEALADIEKVLSIDASDEIALLNKGIIFQERGDATTALKFYSKVIELNADNTLALYFRGMLYLQNLMPENGCADLKKSMENGSKEAADALKRYCK